MMINGDWLYNEMLTYSVDHTLPENFELKIMDTPKIVEDAEKSGYIIGEDQSKGILRLHRFQICQHSPDVRPYLRQP